MLDVESFLSFAMIRPSGECNSIAAAESHGRHAAIKNMFFMSLLVYEYKITENNLYEEA